MSSSVSNLNSSGSPQDQLIELISPWVFPLGYQIIHLEVQSHRQKILRIFIDYLEPSSEKTIGIQDCVQVSKVLDERLDQLPEIESAFHGTYELEVSSPGVDRPLRTAFDFSRFTGKEVRIHVYRPLSSEEIENVVYQERNPKQKNFFGTLVGLKNGKVGISISSSSEKGSQKAAKKGKAQSKALPNTNSEEGTQVFIPLPLISKANLEPKFDFETSNESE